MDYILYGGELSYFTGKARAYMRYKGLDFEERPATRAVYKEIILPNVGAPIVPVLQTADGEIVQDTTDIIDYLETRHPQVSIYPNGPRQKLVSLLLEQYGDEWLVIPAMHYRWSVLDQQYDFIMREFGAMSAPDESAANQIVIGEKTSAPFRGSIAMLGITEATIPAIEAVYAEFLRQLNTHFTEYPFLLGSRPSIGDFGLMGPLYAHLGRDPVPKAMMQAEAPAVYAWVQRMNQPDVLGGDFLADDEVPATLYPILETLSRDFLPDVLDVLSCNDSYIEAHPGQNVPRYLGMHAFRTGAGEGERVVNSFSQWMFQRAWCHYQALSGSERESVDELLLEIGAMEALQIAIRHPLRRKPGQLELVEDPD